MELSLEQLQQMYDAALKEQEEAEENYNIIQSQFIEARKILSSIDKKFNALVTMTEAFYNTSNPHNVYDSVEEELHVEISESVEITDESAFKLPEAPPSGMAYWNDAIKSSRVRT